MTKRSDEAPAEIKALRDSLGLNQEQFAQALEVSKTAVSAWERGLYEPSPATYLKMGNLASRNDVLWFWERAGLDRKVILSAAGNLLRGNDVPPTAEQIARVPELGVPVEITISTAARILRISQDAVVRLITSGKLIGRRAGSTAHYWISYGSVIDELARNVAERESALRPSSKDRAKGK